MAAYSEADTSAAKIGHAGLLMGSASSGSTPSGYLLSGGPPAPPIPMPGSMNAAREETLPERISRLAVDTSEAAHILGETRVQYQKWRENLQGAEARYQQLSHDLANALGAMHDQTA